MPARHSPPLIIAHRGFSGRHPENTLEAIEAAICLGVDFVEIDVQQTSDRQLVVFHDRSLRRLCGVSGWIREQTLVRLRRLYPPIPTLAEVLGCCRNRCGVLIEIKQADPAEVVCEVRRLRMEKQVILFTFSVSRLKIVARTGPELRRFGLIDNSLWRSIKPLLTVVPVEGVALSRRLLRSRSTVVQLQQRGWKVFVWTVNRPDSMRRLAAWGVDGLITNYPDRARSLLAG